MVAKAKRIRLFNTVTPVNTFYHDLIPCLEQAGSCLEVVISRAEYRPGRENTWRGEQTEVHWTPTWGTSMNGRVGRLFILVAYILSAAAHTLIGHEVDYNVFLTQPPLFYVWGYFLKRLRHQPYFVVIMDLYPDVALEAAKLNADSRIARFLNRVARFGLEQAEGVIVIGRQMRQRVIDKGVTPERVHVIPNWADEEAIRPLAHAENSFRAAQGWTDKFVILYSGNMGIAHYFDDILETSWRMRDDKRVIFAFIGHGRRLAEIEAFKSTHGLENIIILPFQPQANLAQSIGSADVHFVSLRAEYSGLMVPSKAYGILAAGCPVIYQGAREGEIACLIHEEEVGIYVSIGDTLGLQQAIEAYLVDPELCRRHGICARHLIESTYSRQAALMRYAQMLGVVDEERYDPAVG